jgi:hypothetical protein
MSRIHNTGLSTAFDTSDQELPRKPDLAKDSGTVITSCMIVKRGGLTIKTLEFGT